MFRLLRFAALVLIMYLFLLITSAPGLHAQSVPTPITQTAQGDPVVRIVRLDPARATQGQPIVVDAEVNGASFPPCEAQDFRVPVDVMLAIDASGSMQDNNLIASARSAAIAFLNVADPAQDRVGLLEFSSGVRVHEEPTNNYEVLRTRLQGIFPSGGTDTTGAIQEASAVLLQAQLASDAQPVIVLLTDGMPDNERTAIAAAQQARQDDIRIIAINAGEPSGEQTLRQMVSDPDDYFFAPGPADLEPIFEQVARNVQNMALAGKSVRVIEQVAPGFEAISASIMPSEGRVEGTTIVWEFPRIARNESIDLSYAIRPTTSGQAHISAGEMVEYIDCNRQTQQISAPILPVGEVSIVDPQQLITSSKDTMSFVGPEQRPNLWIWIGLAALVAVLVGGALYALVLRK